MAQVTVTLSKELDKVVGIVKSIYGLSSKNEAIQFIIEKEGENILEKELRPEFVRKMLNLKKTGKFRRYSSVAELKDEIEHA